MKKIGLMLLMVFTIIGASVNAQTVEKSRFFDNWSLGLKGGITTPINHAAFWGDARPIVGVELTKKVTPIFALGVEGAWTINTSPVTYGLSNLLAFDRQYVGSLMKVNMMNAIGGYRGTPRVCEVELVGSIGWQHDYFHDLGLNSWYTKWGTNINFNLGARKIWTLSIKPSIVFDMNGRGTAEFNKNFANFELVAGITYNFKNSNGTHSFVLCDKIYTQHEMDVVNAEVNALRQALYDCENREPIVIENVIIKEVPTEKETVIEFPPIAFNFDSAFLTDESNVTLVWMANELNKCSCNIILNGYASEEGNYEYNKELSLQRANAVKDALVKNGVDANRISTIGNGATTQFGTPQMNRVVITTF